MKNNFSDQEYRDIHKKLREILIKYGNVEYGDCIVDEICFLFGYPTTNDVTTNEVNNKLETLKRPILNLFQSFLSDKISRKELITELYKFETDLKNLDDIGDRDLWFKFFKDDTGATTIKDLDKDLIAGLNDTFKKECMQLAVSNPEEFKIYFS